MEFFATCPKGLEYLLVDELKALGAADVREALAGVHFRRELDAGYNACLWPRLASRVLMPIAEFPVADGDARHLYAKYGFVETGPASVNMEYIVAPHAPE